MRTIHLLIVLLIWTTSYSQQLVMPGDYPDPSVVKIGDTYWASATTSNWAPAFPLLSSKDLIDWKVENVVFNKLPDWADYYFWAPEITYENGKVYIYYAAHKRGGNMCIATAVADKPEGPYTDLGPLMCEAAGSIDAFPMRDEKGTLYMIWKEDGNSVKKPTPIWAMQMSEDRKQLIGEKKELFHNDTPWENNLVEGVAMLKQGEYYYALYSASGCCGNACSYGVGVARSKVLLGPWEKYEANPLIKTSDQWNCPGHGTAVKHNDKYYFLFHAYDPTDGIYAGRQGVLSEFKFTSDGWIKFEDRERGKPKLTDITEEFNGAKLSLDWQTSVFQNIKTEMQKGALYLDAIPVSCGAYVGVKTLSGNYEAQVTINSSIAESGIGLIGDDHNTMTATIKNDSIIVSSLIKDKMTIHAKRKIQKSSVLMLKVIVQNGKDVRFEYALPKQQFTSLHDGILDGSYLPPWDRAVRVGLVAKGEKTERAIFERFALTNKQPK